MATGSRAGKRCRVFVCARYTGTSSRNGRRCRRYQRTGVAAQVAERRRSSEAAEPSAYRQAQDEWQRETGREIALAIGRYLEARGRLHQPISVLRIKELEGMAWAAVAIYQDRREALRQKLLAEGREAEAAALKDRADLLLGV